MERWEVGAIVGALDSALRTAATDILSDLGTTCVVTVYGTRSYDETTGHVTESSDTDYTENCSPPAPASDRYFPADTIEDGDSMVFLAAADLTFTPDAGQKVVVNSGTWRVVAVDRYDSGTLTALWGLHLRD